MGNQPLLILSFVFSFEAHLFWWLYRSPYRVEDPSHPWPTVLWLEGGPGGSGAGIGNFFAIGPLDVNLDPRNYTWLKKADLLFVDSPVGTGFSYVEDEKLLVRTDEDAATDLTTLLKKLFNSNETLQKSSLYIFGESYGGKFAVTLGLSAIKAIEAGQLKLQLGGIVLGNSWISPEDFVVSSEVHKQLARGAFMNATSILSDIEDVVSENSNNVDFYNFLMDSQNDPLYPDDDLVTGLMNGPIREKLKIIRKNVTWQAVSNDVFEALVEGDFIKPIKNERVGDYPVLPSFLSFSFLLLLLPSLPPSWRTRGFSWIWVLMVITQFFLLFPPPSFYFFFFLLFPPLGEPVGSHGIWVLTVRTRS
ncbi:hypothetical protein SLEP1_g21606 [Rubroshorea leprosula]|uniref:Carboxypeptidase n=1 Tax=Rubroshorea leprosula TaxID=152421 RepID=A0AAV5JBV5_9ROSI|nr:hypothetical protein SLEP1_g21606 [Rubroshorea leprosula]